MLQLLLGLALFVTVFLYYYYSDLRNRGALKCKTGLHSLRFCSMAKRCRGQSSSKLNFPHLRSAHATLCHQAVWRRETFNQKLARHAFNSLMAKTRANVAIVLSFALQSCPLLLILFFVVVGGGVMLNRRLSNDFTIHFGEIHNIQIVQWPENIKLQVRNFLLCPLF